MTDRGLLYGEGLFETVRVVDGQPRHLELHLARLARSCAELGLPAPPEIEVPREDGLVRITWTAGAEPAGPFDDGPRAAPQLLVSTRPAGAESPVRLASVAFRPSQHAAHKTLARWPYLRARRKARELGADDALLFDGDDALEATSSNLVARIDGTLLTPPADGRILPGIGRAVLALEERRLTREDLRRAEAMWLVGSTYLQPRPVVALDGVEYPAAVLA